MRWTSTADRGSGRVLKTFVTGLKSMGCYEEIHMASITQINSRRVPEVSAAAAELRLALNAVRDLVRQGTTSGEAWNQADVRQRKATVAWQLALRKVHAPIWAQRR